MVNGITRFVRERVDFVRVNYARLLRYTFKIFAHTMGLHVIGLCMGSHATIYQKKERYCLKLEKN